MLKMSKFAKLSRYMVKLEVYIFTYILDNLVSESPCVSIVCAILGVPSLQ